MQKLKTFFFFCFFDINFGCLFVCVFVCLFLALEVTDPDNRMLDDLFTWVALWGRFCDAPLSGLIASVGLELCPRWGQPVGGSSSPPCYAGGSSVTNAPFFLLRNMVVETSTSCTTTAWFKALRSDWVAGQLLAGLQISAPSSMWICWSRSVSKSGSRAVGHTAKPMTLKAKP